MLGLAYARSYLTNGKKVRLLLLLFDRYRAGSADGRFCSQVEGMLKLWDGYKNLGWRGYDCQSRSSVRLSFAS